MAEQIEPAQWANFFTEVTRAYDGCEAHLERSGRAFGDQEATTWLPFTGISYDPHHAQIFITLGGSSSHAPVHLTHQIAHPWIVAVHRTPEGEVHGVLVVSEDKTERRLTFRRQPQLAT
jgi:hypothetical protein